VGQKKKTGILQKITVDKCGSSVGGGTRRKGENHNSESSLVLKVSGCTNKSQDRREEKRFSAGQVEGEARTSTLTSRLASYNRTGCVSLNERNPKGTKKRLGKVEGD